MKHFFEVFENLELRDGMLSLFQDVLVSRVTISRDKTQLRIYIHSRHVIDKADSATIPFAARQAAVWNRRKCW